MGKLVRDQIPEMIRNEGRRAEERALTGDEYLGALFEKLQEEASELQQARTKAQRKDEIADLLEVLQSLAKVYELEWESIEERTRSRREERGGLTTGTYLEYFDQL